MTRQSTSSWFERLSAISADEYRVSNQMPLAAVMAIITFLAILLAGLRIVGLPEHVHYFMISLVLGVAFAQMLLGRLPRGASVMIGALLLLAWVAVLELSGRHFLTVVNLDTAGAWGTVILLGGILGYGAGTLIAGIFLTIDVVASLVATPAATEAASGE